MFLLCFYQQIRDGLFWIRPEVRILGADQGFSATVMAGRRVLRRSVLLVLVLTLVLTLDPPKSSAELPNSYWSVCKVLSLDRECYSRFIVRNSTQRYSRFITKDSTQRYCSVEVVSPVLKVESGLCLFDATLVASYLLLLAGDICENRESRSRNKIC